MKKYKCYKCGHEWIPRTMKPIECPNCKSRDWRFKIIKKNENGK